MDKITFVIPSRNNLDLLKLAYKSIRNLKGKYEILVLDDASIDGTGEWLEARDDSADDSDQDHPEIDQVEGVALNPDHPNCTHQPDEDKC